MPRSVRSPEGTGPLGRRCDPPDGTLRQDLPDLRNWISGLHAGSRTVHEGEIA